MAFFTVLPPGRLPRKSDPGKAYLITDEWDDWFEFSTMYALRVFDEGGEEHPIGNVKIGQFGMKRGQRRAELPSEFDALGSRFFSLGQDESYYAALASLETGLRDKILLGLQDVAKDLSHFDEALPEPVTTTSLLRFVSPNTVRGQFHRMATGGVRLSQYDFSYVGEAGVGDKDPPFVLSFAVEPFSNPPSNIHVIVGRNGVGKTRVLRRMARHLMGQSERQRASDLVEFAGTDAPATRSFAGIVSVSFSAFDPFDNVVVRDVRPDAPRYAYIGLQRPKPPKGKSRPPKGLAALTSEFTKSMANCLQGPRSDRWRQALDALESDPLFREAGVATLTRLGANWERSAGRLFRRLSSGHKIVLLTMTKLVEEVEERTLVLIDEPEAHLHAPLLAAFVRALSNLLVVRNAVAIIATHSPVVLQEVPRTCVWKLRRTGREVLAERPEIETFGENIGVLTREAFGLEVTAAGFHQMLWNAVNTSEDYDAVRAMFGDQLGGEARAIVRALIAARQDPKE